jgi:hypothetical protein
MRPRRIVVRGLILLTVVAGLWVAGPARDQATKIRFVNATEQSRVDFIHSNGLSG